MKTAIKIIAVLVVLVIAGIVALLWLGASQIDAIAKQAVERGGTYAMQVETTVASVDVGLLDGTIDLDTLRVANPEGYQTEHFMLLTSAGAQADLNSVREYAAGNTDLIEAPYLRLHDLDLKLEKREGKANYEVILENLKRFEEQGGGDAKPPATGGRETQFVIREVTIENIQVEVDLLPVGGEFSRTDVTVDKIELTNVGSGGEPLRISDLMGVILKATLSAVVETAGELIPPVIVGDLEGQLAQLQDLGDLGVGVVTTVGGETFKIVEGVAGEVGKAAEGIGKGVGDAAKGVGDAAEGAGKAVGDAAKGIGDLLGGGEKKEDEKDGSSSEGGGDGGQGGGGSGGR